MSLSERGQDSRCVPLCVCVCVSVCVRVRLRLGVRVYVCVVFVVRSAYEPLIFLETVSMSVYVSVILS